MFHNKNPNIHQALANKFNRKKTIANDIERINSFYQTNKMINHTMKVDVRKPKNEEFDTDNNDSHIDTIYTMNGNRTSTKLNLHLNNEEEEMKMIPKIMQKEILIPKYSENDNFDFTSINKNINQMINMDINLFDNIYDADIEKIHKKNVKIINNVYQESYTDEKNPTGFGDFIRGCYFLLQFCRKYNFKPNIIINHPLSLFLEKYHKHYYINQTINKDIFSSIPMFVNSNWKDSDLDLNGFITNVITSKKTLAEIISYLYSLKVSQGSIFMYNILFPYDEVEEKDKIILRDILQPNLEMKTYVEETMNSLGLETKKYSVIHIRSGDMYLSEETKIFDSFYFKKVCNEVFNIINNNSSMEYLLIADNNEIKYLLCEIFPNIKTIYKEITHLGEGKVLERNKIKNTMLDFYLMSNSNSINSFTGYVHGSGFSLWCATTYNLPYTCKYIKVPN